MRLKASSVDEYIDGYHGDVKKRLQQFRKVIRHAAPDAEELISYGIVGYKQQGMLIYFAGYKNHIGVYPVTPGMKVYAKEVAMYQTSKGTMQFPHDKPIPFELIGKLTKIRVKENAEKAAIKKEVFKKSLKNR